MISNIFLELHKIPSPIAFSLPPSFPNSVKNAFKTTRINFLSFGPFSRILNIYWFIRAELVIVQIGLCRLFFPFRLSHYNNLILCINTQILHLCFLIRLKASTWLHLEKRGQNKSQYASEKNNNNNIRLANSSRRATKIQVEKVRRCSV